MEKEEFNMKEFKKFKPGLKNNAAEKGGLKEEAATADESNAPAELSATATQKIWSNYLASTFEEFPFFTPPDVNGAVGPSQVVAVTNNMIKVFDKQAVTDPPLVSYQGVLHTPAPSQFAIPLYYFFYPALTDGFPSDPHIRFDRLTKRWFITAMEIAQSDPVNNVLLAVSDGERITDETNFTFYQIPSDLLPRNTASGAPFFDQPRLGIDKNAVLIGGSSFFTHTDSCNGFYYDSLYSVGIALDKKALFRGFLAGYVLKLGSWQFNEGTGSGMLFPRGVYNDNPAAPKSFFAGINYTPGTDPTNGIFLTALTYNTTGGIIDYSETTVPVDPFQLPRGVLALGSPMTIDPTDTRILDACIYKNKLTGKSGLWTAHAIGVNQSAAFVTAENYTQQARTASRWYEVGNIYTKPNVAQSGTVYDAAQENGRRAISYFNPSIAANGQGNAVLGGTTAAYNRYLNAFVAGQFYGDAKGMLGTPQKVTATRAIYALNFGTAVSPDYVDRWGDYSQTVVDPMDDQTIWSFQEYAASDDNFGVRAIQVKAPPPATPMPLNTLSNKDNIWVTVKGVSVDHSGFFDPGTDKGGPGYNRLSVKVSGGTILVSSVKFVSPTEIRFRLGLKSKPAGKYTLVITNPDGQVVTTDFTISTESITTMSSKAPLQITEKYLAGSGVYPNPTPDKFTLRLTAVQDWKARVVLLDVSGKQVSATSHNFSKGANEVALSLAGYSKGTYLALVYGQNNTVIAVEKIVKE